jgi:hypothetical protein
MLLACRDRPQVCLSVLYSVTVTSENALNACCIWAQSLPWSLTYSVLVETLATDACSRSSRR